LNFHGLLVALVRRRGTTLRWAIAVAAVVAVSVAIAIPMAEAALAAEWPLVAPALEATLVARRLMMLRHRRMRRLEALLEQILPLLVPEIIADVTRLTQPLTVAIG
jgi:hypothetical protein